MKWFMVVGIRITINPMIKMQKREMEGRRTQKVNIVVKIIGLINSAVESHHGNRYIDCLYSFSIKSQQ